MFSPRNAAVPRRAAAPFAEIQGVPRLAPSERVVRWKQALEASLRRRGRIHRGRDRSCPGCSRDMLTPLARLRVDHLVYGVTGSLEAAMDAFRLRTGVAPVRGGRHEGLGTHNALVSLGDGAYFEIICRDPEQPSPPRLWMGMESLSEERSAVMLTWATERVGEMAEAVRAARAQGYDPGDVEAFERSKPDGSTLRWRLAYRHFTRLQQGAGSGIVPFLIEWESASPAAAAPGGIELVGLRAEARDLAAVERSLRCLDIARADLQLQRGEEDRLFAMLRTPKGIIEF